MDKNLHLIPKGEEEYFSSSEQSQSTDDDGLETPSPREHPKYHYQKEMKDKNYERLSHFLFGLIIGYLYKDFIS